MWLRVNENVYCKWQQILQNNINIYSYLAKPKPPDRETSSSTSWPKTSSVVPTVYVLYSLVVCIIYYTIIHTYPYNTNLIQNTKKEILLFLWYCWHVEVWRQEFVLPTGANSLFITMKTYIIYFTMKCSRLKVGS